MCWIPNIAYHLDTRIASLLAQRREQILLRKYQWRTPLVSDLRFNTHTNEAIRLADTLSGASSPIPVKWSHVRFLADAEDDVFHASEPSPETDGDVCLLSDTLEAMLVEETSNNQAGNDQDAITPPPTNTAGKTMLHRELLMCDSNPVGGN